MKILGKTLYDDLDESYVVTGTRLGHNDILIYILKCEDGSRAEVQDHDVGTDANGRLVICGEIWFK